MNHHENKRSLGTVRLFAVLALVLLTALTSMGCELLDLFDFDDADFRSCDSRSDGSLSNHESLTGLWTFSGAGERDSCDDDIFNGSFQLGGTIAIETIEDLSDDDQSLIQLTAAPSMSGGQFLFNGTARGTCVDLTTEETSAGTGISFSFVGNRALSSQVEGDFTSDGPGGCHSTGTFRIDIQ